MNKYEVALVIKPLFPEDIKSKVFSTIEALVTKLGGNISITEDWGKKHMAYELLSVERTKYEEGYYLICLMNLASSEVKKLEKSLKLNSDLLRFLIIKD